MTQDRQVSVQGDALRMFVPFGKIEKQSDGSAYFEGFATVDELDKSDEIVAIEASRQAFGEWASEVGKMTGGKSHGNIRAMHAPIAAGRAMTHEERKTEDGSDGIYLTGYIDDVPEATKALKGTYGGLSIAGSVKSREARTVDGRAVSAIVGYDLTEVSLVDRPCAPSAVLTMVKRDGTETPHPGTDAWPLRKGVMTDALRALLTDMGVEGVAEMDEAAILDTVTAGVAAEAEPTEEPEPVVESDADADVGKAVELDMTKTLVAAVDPLRKAIEKIQISLAGQADERRAQAEETSGELSKVTGALAELRSSSEQQAERLAALEKQPGPVGSPIAAEKRLGPDTDGASAEDAASELLKYIASQPGVPKSVVVDAGVALAAARRSKQRGA